MSVPGEPPTSADAIFGNCFRAPIAPVLFTALALAACKPAPTTPAAVTEAPAPEVAPAIKIVTEPEQSVSGQQLSPAPAVRVTDERGLPAAGVVVTASIEPGSFAEGSTVEVATDQEGRAAFDSLRIARAGAYRLGFAAPLHEAARSAEFVVRFGIPRVMTMVRQPRSGPAGVALGGEPAVRVTDDAGNPVPGVNVDARLEASGASAGKLATVATDAEGLAVFSDIVINAPGTGCRLKFDARAAGVNDVVSQPFNLTNS